LFSLEYQHFPAKEWVLCNKSRRACGEATENNEKIKDFKGYCSHSSSEDMTLTIQQIIRKEYTFRWTATVYKNRQASRKDARSLVPSKVAEYVLDTSQQNLIAIISSLHLYLLQICMY